MGQMWGLLHFFNFCVKWKCILLKSYVNTFESTLYLASVATAQLRRHLPYMKLIFSLYENKANLRDLIAATGQVILLKLDLNHRFFSPCDLEIWWMTFKNNRAPLLCYFKLCAAFRSHWWIQTGVRVRKRPIWIKFDAFLEPCDLEIWRMTLKNNRAPLLCYLKLCAAFRSHWCIQTGVRVRKRPIWVIFDAF